MNHSEWIEFIQEQELLELEQIYVILFTCMYCSIFLLNSIVIIIFFSSSKVWRIITLNSFYNHRQLSASCAQFFQNSSSDDACLVLVLFETCSCVSQKTSPGSKQKYFGLELHPFKSTSYSTASLENEVIWLYWRANWNASRCFTPNCEIGFISRPP